MKTAVNYPTNSMSPMRAFTASLLFGLSTAAAVQVAAQPVPQITHHCLVFTVVQHYDLASMKFKFAVEAKTEWFDVTTAPHEEEKSLEIRSQLPAPAPSTSRIGAAKVWTGTLPSTPDGDVLQAHATFTIEKTEGSANLIMSLDSRLAKSSVVLGAETATE